MHEPAVFEIFNFMKIVDKGAQKKSLERKRATDISAALLNSPSIDVAINKQVTSKALSGSPSPYSRSKALLRGEQPAPRAS